MTDNNRLTDLVARLRFYANPLNREAADAIMELMAALKPFADIAKEVEAESLRYVDIDITVAVADLRAARAAMEGKDD